jgi:ATP-dependent Lon protease
METTNKTTVNKTSVLPVAPLRDGPVYPNTDIPLAFGRSKSVAALKNAAESNHLIFVVAQKNPNEVETNPENLYQVGTICQVKHIFSSETEVSVFVYGVARAKVVRYQQLDAFLVAEVEQIEDVIPEDPEIPALSSHIIAEFQNAVRLGRSFDFFVLMKITGGLGPSELSNQMAAILDFTSIERQTLLEETNVKKRLARIAEKLAEEIKVLELERKIVSQSQEKFDKNVKRGLLEERKKAIERELGEEDEEKQEADTLRLKAKKANMPEEVFKKVTKEIKRLEEMNNMNPEKGYIQAYVDWLLSMPWDIRSETKTDIKAAEKILDEDHFGLKKAKERITEYLAVLKLKSQQPKKSDPEESKDDEESKSAVDLPKAKAVLKKSRDSVPTILCFVGPPGVGKTSIGKSIAKALGRKFVRVSLGGIRDEAEIRGHRRTYVGALPGRIIQGIKQAGTKNPVFMLDEIDKIGADFRGDPSSALLEALDPEQNNAFSDHYLDVPYDLSEVIFITTANVLDTIPPALLDRLEIIEFPGYTVDEKFNIAKKYLLSKELEVNGIKPSQIDFTDAAMKVIIERYTRESGVRSLEREMATVLRKVAKVIASGKNKSMITIKPTEVNKYLGPFRFTSDMAERKDEVGLATGLAWSPVGGSITFIEVALMPGKGGLILTGSLGDVMQESAKAALTYVRSHYEMLGIPEKIFQKIDIHVHVPDAGTKKDGPSAGLAMTTALTSALTKIAVKKSVAITGEVTLRGRAGEVGGIKEKVIGAHLAGIKTVIMPKSNQKDLEDIPDYVLKDINFKFVENMDQVLEVALTEKPRNNLISSGKQKKMTGKFAHLEIPVEKSRRQN